MEEKVQWAVRNGDLDSLQSKDFDPNLVFNGSPLLVSAADYGQSEVIKFLIKKGASVNKASTHGITPLLAAVWEDHVEAVKILIDNGAAKDGKTPDGSSYLEVAQSDEIKQLLK